MTHNTRRRGEEREGTVEGGQEVGPPERKASCRACCQETGWAAGTSPALFTVAFKHRRKPCHKGDMCCWACQASLYS